MWQICSHGSPKLAVHEKTDSWEYSFLTRLKFQFAFDEIPWHNLWDGYVFLGPPPMPSPLHKAPAVAVPSLETFLPLDHYLHK